jgi:threonine/homoserine/homoserine lactone efflux protein
MTFFAFLVAAVVLAMTPGPGIAYVVARTVAGGRAEGLASCFGTGLGGLLQVLAAALGLSLLLAQSAAAFNIVKYLGAAYLIYLGIHLLMRNDSSIVVQPVAAQGGPTCAAGRNRYRGAERQDRAFLPCISAAVRRPGRAAGSAARAARKHLRRAQYAGGRSRRACC